MPIVRNWSLDRCPELFDVANKLVPNPLSMERKRKRGEKSAKKPSLQRQSIEPQARYTGIEEVEEAPQTQANKLGFA